MSFFSKVFKQDSPFFTKLGQIWTLEAQLEELLSLLIPEADKTKNPLIIDYADKIMTVSQDMKSHITDVIEEMEDTRKEMFRVGKQMLKLKD